MSGGSFGAGFTFITTGYNCGLLQDNSIHVVPKDLLVLNYDISDQASYSSGTTVTDLKGNSNATLFNSPTYSSGYLQFNGTNQYLITTTSLAQEVTTDITTIAMWAYPMDNGVLLSERGEASISSTWHDSQMEMVGGAMRFGMWNGLGISYVQSSIATPLNAWYHLSMVYDGTKLSAYVNGNVAGSITFSRLNPIEGAAGLFYAIAAADSTAMGDATYANMRLGAFQVYNAALNGDQIYKLFNDRRSQYGL